MSIWIAMLLGLVQGLCEFLPISSSGHLLLLQKMFGITEGQLFFTVMLHIGTLAAVLIVYRKMIWKLLRHPFQKTVLYLIVAIIPTVIVALLFKKVSPFDRFYEAAEQGKYLGVCFLITSALLNAAELFERPRSRRRKLQNMQFKDAVAVGCMQGVGVLPGVSVRYTVNGEALKEDIILENAEALHLAALRLPQEYDYEVTARRELLVKDQATGKALFCMDAPLVYDAEGKETAAQPEG